VSSADLRMKIYLAGPDVFRHDASLWAQQARAMCMECGVEALVPLDGDATTAPGIYAKNIAMIAAADVIVANLNPFRGSEPDSGTCFEVGYALALGKRVVGYVATDELLSARIERVQGRPLVRNGDDWLDADGMRIENFDLPLNLMLGVPVQIIQGDLTAALRICIAGRSPANLDVDSI
jgi:nucleoside 2-deoxyribosyltransferase